MQTTKNSLSELEKRERRAMERKISEMEEELKVIRGFFFFWRWFLGDRGHCGAAGSNAIENKILQSK